MKRILHSIIKRQPKYYLLFLQDSGNDTLVGLNCNKDFNGINGNTNADNLSYEANKLNLEGCIRRKYGWKQLRLQIIVIRKFKQALYGSSDSTSNSSRFKYGIKTRLFRSYQIQRTIKR